jgi:hypothetical protein
VVALLTGEALQVVNVVSGSHYHLEGWYYFCARRTVSSSTKQPADSEVLSVFRSSAFLLNDSQPHNDFYGQGKLKFWHWSNGDVMCQAT